MKKKETQSSKEIDKIKKEFDIPAYGDLFNREKNKIEEPDEEEIIESTASSEEENFSESNKKPKTSKKKETSNISSKSSPKKEKSKGTPGRPKENFDYTIRSISIPNDWEKYITTRAGCDFKANVNAYFRALIIEDIKKNKPIAEVVGLNSDNLDI